MLSIPTLIILLLTACDLSTVGQSKTTAIERGRLPTQTPIQDALLTWEGPGLDDGCKSLWLSSDGQAMVGSCGKSQTLYRLSNDVDRVTQWAFLLTSYAPFESTTGEEKISFHGQGNKVVSPHWQRAISAWAQLVAAELELGRSGASWGTALSWVSEIPQRTGYCKFLQVERYGYAYASTARCEGGDAHDLGNGWLSSLEWEQFDFWYYNRAPVYDLEGVNLFSRGVTKMTQDEIANLSKWSETVFERLDK